MKITFLGTGTSQGVPVIACDCDTCCSDDPRDKRLRSSVLIETKTETILIDPGPDFRQQLLREKVRKLDGILITHEHIDHIAGLDDVRSFNFIFKRPMEIYCEERVELAIRRIYSYVFAEKKYPGIPSLNINRIKTSEFSIGKTKILPIRAMHLKLPVLAFRVNDFAYITDVNFIPEEAFEKLKGLKVLAINALRRKPHISHFNVDEALAAIERINPEKSYFTHISHMLERHEIAEPTLPDSVFLAFDGLCVSC